MKRAQYRQTAIILGILLSLSVLLPATNGVAFAARSRTRIVSGAQPLVSATVLGLRSGSLYRPTPTPTPTPTPAAQLSVASTPTTHQVSRIGVNLGFWNSYGAEQLSANIVMNPGFEPVIDRAIVIVQDSNSSGFSDNSASMARANGFWAGATFEVRTGASAGISGVIASSLGAGSDGMPWFNTNGPAPVLAAGDVVSVTQTETSGPIFAWCWPSSSNGYTEINTSDHRPGSPGYSVAELKVQPTASTELDQYWDGQPNVIPGGKFLPVNGAWQLSFWARTTAGTATLEADFLRGGANSYFVHQVESLNSGWQQFTVNFTANDNGPAKPLALRFVASGTAGTLVHIDDVQLERVSDNGNAWRAEVIQNLKQMQPGYLRDLELQLGDTASNRLATAFARSPQRWQPDPANQLATYLYGLPDFLSLCQQVGAQPWIVVPATFYDEEFTQLGQYLASAQSLYNFKEIVVEFGNENWNSQFRSASIPDPETMGSAANRGFGLLRTAAGQSVPLHLVVNSAFRNALVGEAALINAPEADAVDTNAYFFNTLNAADTQATALSAMFDVSDETTYIPEQQADAAGKDVDAYEINLKTTDGDAPASQRNPFDAGMVSGTALANRLIEGMNLGLHRQLVFDLSGYNHNISTTLGNVDLWGVARDLANPGDLRPTGLALQMLNGVISGDFYQATITGSGSNVLNAAAFLTSTGWSFVIVSESPTATAVRVSVPSGGASPTKAYSLSASTITTDNETGTNVQIVSTQLSRGPQVTVPAYGLVVLEP